ncbi:hypothetical protein [Clostridium guangxiense]|uniref:hypothetical protein n=1 Tax=Clostridium guangxiense TaxID=1662055 RepID=UPI001E55A6D8|nr:hypothetical protein [Clostridium guangxiense]MCD2345801.1 hypothetical protein [Clostridium guangxiense]
MSNKEIVELIKFIPNIFIYIVPGYSFFKVSSFILSKELINDKEAIIKYVLMSYVIVNIVKLFIWVDINSPIFIIVTLLMSILFAFIYSKGIRCDKFDRFLQKLSIKKTYTIDVWDDIERINKEYNGYWITIYIDNEKVYYQGILKKCQEQQKEKDYYIFLKKYRMCTYNLETVEDFTDNDKYWVAIKANGISRMEIEYYPKENKKSS